MKKHSPSIFLTFLSVFLFVSLACGSSTVDKLSSAVPATTIPAESLETETVGEQTQVAQPTITLKIEVPTDTPVPEAEPMAITTQGYGQDGQEFGYGFFVNNPNSNYAYEDSQYQIAIYNADGTVIETDTGYIELVLPGQQLGIGGSLYLDEGAIADKMEIQLSQGDIVEAGLSETLTAGMVAYRPGDYSSSAVGVINNPFASDLTSLRVSAIAYNDSGEIIGGGFTYMNFILANSSVGVNVLVTSSGKVERVDIFPSLSGLSMLSMDDQIPDGASELVLSKQGFGQDGTNLGIGMLIENLNQAYAVENSMYHVTSFSEDGSVLGVSEGYINLILPDQTIGLADSHYLDEGVTVSRIEIQIKEGDYSDSNVLPGFTSENVAYIPDQYSPQVTGEIANPYGKEITYVRVDAIAYNDEGEIIGGGLAFVDFIPANSKAAVEVYITVAGTPSVVELYATVSGLSEIEG